MRDKWQSKQTVSDHDTVALGDGPDVDPAVFPSCGQQAAGASSESQTGNCAGVGLELLWRAKQMEMLSSVTIQYYKT